MEESRLSWLGENCAICAGGATRREALLTGLRPGVKGDDHQFRVAAAVLGARTAAIARHRYSVHCSRAAPPPLAPIQHVKPQFLVRFITSLLVGPPASLHDCRHRCAGRQPPPRGGSTGAEGSARRPPARPSASPAGRSVRQPAPAPRHRRPAAGPPAHAFRPVWQRRTCPRQSLESVWTSKTVERQVKPTAGCVDPGSRSGWTALRLANVAKTPRGAVECERPWTEGRGDGPPASGAPQPTGAEPSLSPR